MKKAIGKNGGGGGGGDWVLAIGRLGTANTECGAFLSSGRCCGDVGAVLNH